jgi:Zn-dependent protease
MAPPIPPEASKEIEFVKGLVAKHFPVYDVRVSYDVVQFFCRVDTATLEDSFEQMREDMAPHGYIPMITYDGGEHIIQVARKPKMKYRSIYVNLAFFIITFLTMLLAGVLSWASYSDSSGAILTWDNLAMGVLTFTIPLMAILGVHELGHFFMARRRKVAASLPFFIPSFPPLGTFGAFISLRDPIPNRKALLEIGVAGPLCGLVLAIPLAILGLILTNDGAKLAPQNVGGNVIGVSFPLLYAWIEQFFPLKGDYLLHPTAFAAWVGILVTALNLLPVGQLDGGHIARALLGNKTKYLSWGVAAILIALSVYYTGWLLFAMLVLILGVRHPPPLDDISPLGAKRKVVGVLAFAVLIIAFVPQPMIPITQDYNFELTPVDGHALNGTIVPGGEFTTQIHVNNTGNTYNQINLGQDPSSINWIVEFKKTEDGAGSFDAALAVILNASENATLDVRVTAAADAHIGDNESVVILAAAENASIERRLTLNLSVVSPAFTYWVVDGIVTIPRASYAIVSVMLNSTEDTDDNLTLTTNQSRPMFVDYRLFTTNPVGTEAPDINLTLPAHGNVTFGVNITVGATADTVDSVLYVDILMNNANISRIPVAIRVI